MRDLWNDLTRRVREANRVQEPELPFGFADAVLHKVRSAGRDGTSLIEDWISVLRPALGLALGTALVCLLLQYRIEVDQPNDALSQTEALIRLAVLNE